MDWWAAKHIYIYYSNEYILFNGEQGENQMKKEKNI